MARHAPALFFHPDQIEGKGRDLVGRRSAGQSFLEGWLAHCGASELTAVTETSAHGKALSEVLKNMGEKRPLRVVSLASTSDFTRFGTVFFPTPGYSSAAWRRLRFGPERCSLVGITHTVSTRRIIEGLHHLMAEPVEDWDAIICTSNAVRSVVAEQLKLEDGYYRQRFGAARVPQPQLPMIPLGIQTAGFNPAQGARAAMRARAGTPDDAVVVMTMGRLSVIEKGNPVPLFLALEQVAQQADAPVHLWITGWASRKEEEALFIEGAVALCPSVTLKMLDGRDPDTRREVWAGADIFTLSVDSIQETFGLVPIEAMAAGLPVVMPDWDGFRDTVVHGETGFRVPTRMAMPGMGGELARRFADGRDSYLQYLTLVQSHVQVDVNVYALALGALVNDADLRAKMGASAQRHARANYDWAAIIPQYMALADELAARRSGATPTTTQASTKLAVSPLEVDPFALYAGYPSQSLTPETIVTFETMPSKEHLDLIDKISGRVLYRRRAVSQDQIFGVMTCLQDRGSASINILAQELDQPVTVITTIILQLAKADLVQLPAIDPRSL